MCLALPGRLVELDAARPDQAAVEISGVRRAVSTALLGDEPLEPGDWVLVHVGYAISKVDPVEAAELLAALEQLRSA
ncbi:MAG: HypC/HybG/HupF family hydrogenase formation chaperone [Acidimicrobiales bacterium]